MIQTTSFCNGACIFCPYPEVKNELPQGIMEEELFRKIVDECSRYKVERIMPYLMNEPLLDPHLVSRIKYIKEKNPDTSVHILTNGSILNPELSHSLIRSGLDWIGFSVHGIRKKTFEETMGLPFEETMNQIQDFICQAEETRRISEFIMVTFLGHPNLSDRERQEIFEFWQRRGIERISFFEKPISRAGNVSALPKVRHPSVSGCGSIWAREMLHVLYNGEVVLCCMDWRREYVLGNLKEQSISEVWNSEPYIKMRRMVSGKEPSPSWFLCKRCEEALPYARTRNALPEKEILLIFSPPWDTEMPPLGIAYLSSYLEEKGFRTDVLDLNIELYRSAGRGRKELWEMGQYNHWARPDLFRRVLDSMEKDVEKVTDLILKKSPQVIGFSVHGANLLFSVELARRIKQRKHDIRIVFGGTACYHFEEGRPIPSSFYDHYTGDCLIPPGLVDAFVKGEGEETLLELMELFSRGEPVQNIAGVVGYAQGGYSDFNARPLIRDLDRIPFPTFRGFPLNKYSAKRLPLLMSRGCVRRCRFCNDWRLSGEKYRIRSAPHLFQEIEHHVREYDVRDFHFCDLLINGNLERLREISEALTDLPFKIRWSAQAVVHPRMDGVLLKKMRQAGCVCLVYGVESFCDDVLKKMNKPYNRKDIEKVLRCTKDAGIETRVNIIVGFPGEGEEGFRDSVNFLTQYSRYIERVSSLSPCYVTGNSDLELHPEKYGIHLPEHDWWYLWTDKDGNDYPRRREKAREMAALLESLNIPVEFIGIYDTERKKGWKRFLPEIF